MASATDDNSRPCRADGSRPDRAVADPCRPPAGGQCADSPARARKAFAAVFFILLAAHVAINVDPEILYQADEALLSGHKVPVFPYYYQGMMFFRPFLARPGGMAEYLGANVSQYFSIPYGGSAILIGIALIVFLATGALVQRLGGGKGSPLRFVGPLLLVVIWNRYTFFLADQLAMAAALLSACLYLRLPDRSDIRRAALVPAMAVLYWAVGAPALLLAAVVGLRELLAERRATGAICLAIGALAPLVIGAWGFGLPLAQAYGRLIGPQPYGGIVPVVAWAALYGFFVALTVGMALRKRAARLGNELAGRLAAVAGRYPRGPYRTVALPAAALALAVLVALTTLDRDVRTFRRMCYYSQRRQWSRVVRQARRYPADKYTVYTCRMVNRALYETGMLGESMFSYPQTPLGGLLSRMEMDQPHTSDTLLTLGAVSRIEHLALESLELWGPRPFLLRLLAKIYIIKDDLPTARTFLRLLSKDIVHGQWAREQLAAIADDEAVVVDADIMEIRAFMLAEGELDPMSPQATLRALLQRRPDNRMAFEYLMAHYLLTGQLRPLVANMGRLNELGYDTIPRHYAEAMAIAQHEFNITPGLALEGLKRDPAAQEQIMRFAALSTTHGGNIPALAGAVAREMPPSSYFRYFYAGFQAGRTR